MAVEAGQSPQGQNYIWTLIRGDEGAGQIDEDVYSDVWATDGACRACSFPMTQAVVAKEKRYIVTGDREVTSMLTVHDDGRWELSKGSLYDVTHLPCRSGLYTPPAGQPASVCTPTSEAQKMFPVKPGAKMPKLGGCDVQDWAVLFVVGVEV